MASYLWRKYADYLYTKWEKTFLWDMVEPYRRPKSFTPLVTIYIAAFYSGVIGAAITEQLYKYLTRITEGLARALRLSIESVHFGQLHCMNDIHPKLALYALVPKRDEKYWEEHPGKAVPLMLPKFYGGPWRIMGGDVPKFE
ncbi:hypothetical protein V8G54_019866 [Vigna mungo]|uniref:Uncharacterized protein n=1 Tax=Vigna mungo TaxID=3915 RepID=A0AAQ3NCK3_VIGMU